MQMSASKIFFVNTNFITNVSSFCKLLSFSNLTKMGCRATKEKPYRIRAANLNEEAGTHYDKF